MGFLIVLLLIPFGLLCAAGLVALAVGEPVVGIILAVFCVWLWKFTSGPTWVDRLPPPPEKKRAQRSRTYRHFDADRNDHIPDDTWDGPTSLD